jgi:hypothetical protein
MPVRPDGKLDRAQALAWVRANNFSWLGGWAIRQKGGAARQAASIPELDALLPEITAEDWAELENSVREVLQR